MKNFKYKFLYIFHRIFIPLGKAPTFAIALSQIIMITSFMFFIVFLIEYIQTPTSLDGLEITKGQLVDYKYYTGNKYSYCKLKLKMSNNSFNDIKSSRCSHTMHDSRSLGVTIWSKPDLTRFGETAIYQMIRDDGFEIIKFDNKMILASKKGIFYSCIIYIISLILIYISNTDKITVR